MASADNSTPTGHTIVPNWMMTADDVTAHMVLVYAALGTWTGRENTAWPAIDSIAERAKVSPSSTRRALRALEALGLVETFKRGRDDGGRTSNLYRLHTSVTPLSEGQGAPAPLTGEQEPREQPLANARGENTRKRATRIPEPFIVTGEMWEWARTKGIDRAWAVEQTERFVDYWRGASGRSATKQDWPATWRNWLRRSWDERRPAQGSRETPDERFRRLMEEADRMDSATVTDLLGVEA